MALNILFGCDRLESSGFAWEHLNTEATEALTEACNQVFATNERKFGIRDAVGQSALLGVLVNTHLLPIAKKYLHPDAFLVRSTLFDKPEASNWAVPWHQDVTIEVQERHEVAGFGPWSVKEGLTSVQPPTAVLSRMLTLRLHLDPTDANNGALKVEPGSHLHGKLPIHEILSVDPVTCSCGAGEILMMRPLLFHASDRSTDHRPRRVLHLDFAYEQLPEPLRWRTVSSS